MIAAALLGILAMSFSAQPIEQPPSIVLIVTDDQRWDTLWAMPTVQRELVAHGTTFENSFVVDPTCCPSRASTLTGNWPATTGVWRNFPPYGGFASFDDDVTIATALDGAGYETALVGKYLNGYSGTYVPPGWDRWVAFSSPRGYYDYDLNVDGALHEYGDEPTDYSTDVFADHAVSFIEQARGPLFLYFTPAAPHGPPVAAPRHEGTLQVPSFDPPSLNEPDVSDKPEYVRGLHPLDERALGYLAELRQGELETLLAVDEAVGRILDALRGTGRLENTLVVFTSDNGVLWGEHRWRVKQVPYEEAIRVPLVIRYDGTRRLDQHLVANVDLAPTFAELVGITVDAEGRSLLPLLQGQDVNWRTDLLIEYLAKTSRHSRKAAAIGGAAAFGLGLVLALAVYLVTRRRWVIVFPLVAGLLGGVIGYAQVVSSPSPSFCAVRTERYMYALYSTGERELYDLEADPYELENVAESSSVTDELDARTRELCSPTPPDWSS